MSTISIEIPESVRRNAERLAASDGISLDQFFALAAAEKIAALEASDYLAKRASRGDREAFLRVLAKVPDAEPAEWDRLP